MYAYIMQFFDEIKIGETTHDMIYRQVSNIRHTLVGN